MPAFKDNAGREWLIKLDAPTIRAVRQECGGLDLVAEDDSASRRLIADPVLLIEALWILCRAQASPKQITYEQFADGLAGDVLDAATTAMLAGISDFFPTSRRTLVAAVTSKTQKLREAGMAKALAKINDPALEQRLLAKIDAELDRVLTPSNSATNTPASSASTPPD